MFTDLLFPIVTGTIRFMSSKVPMGSACGFPFFGRALVGNMSSGSGGGRALGLFQRVDRRLFQRLDRGLFQRLDPMLKRGKSDHLCLAF